MIPVIIESPFAGDLARNHTYLQRCIRHCLAKGEAPFASHQMYTQALDDASLTQREFGITAGYAWWPFAERIIFYTDYGMSSGMRRAFERLESRLHEFRRIGRNP